MTDPTTQSAFRKKPVVIEAWLIDFGNKPLPDWVNEGFRTDVLDWCPAGEGLYINTLEGHMKGDMGDWLIRGVKGELYACKPDIFEATYEPVSPPPSPVSQHYETPGYALAMRVLQSDLYRQLDDRERAECDALISGGQSSPSVSIDLSRVRDVGEGEPVAYRYKDTRGHWRYVGAPLTPGWAMPENLSHEPLYLCVAAQQSEVRGVSAGSEAAAFDTWMAQWPEHSDRDRVKMFAAWNARAAAPGETATTQAPSVPDGYKLVLVPDEPAPDEPDWEECKRQAETSTGLKVEQNTFSILKREVRRWIAHQNAAPVQSTAAGAPKALKESGK